MLKNIMLGVLTSVSIATSASAGTVIFADQDFNNTDWTLVTQTLDSGGSVTASQILSGGNPDQYRRIENTVFASPAQVYGYHVNAGAVYDPSISGAITSLDYFEDSIMFQGFGLGQATGAAVLQDGNYYHASGLFSNQSTWTSQSQLSLTTTSFVSLSDPTSHPDFSSSGGAITFGFFRRNTANSGPGYTIDAGIDNWSVTINSVNAIPVPPAVWLFGSGLIGLIGIARRKKS